MRRISARGYDLVEAAMPAVISCTQALGAPRYPSLKGIMAARSREIAVRALTDLPSDAPLVPPDGTWTSRVVAAEAPPARAAGRVVEGAPEDAAREIADLLAARRII